MWRLIVIAFLIWGLSGCASVPKYPSSTDANAACIKGDKANFFKYFSEGEAHVRIVDIDNVPAGGDEPYCFPPGKHALGVSAYNSFQMAQDYVDIEFTAGHKYRLRANLRGISFVFQLMDITAQPETKISEFKLKVNLMSQPVSVPIFLPSR